MSTRCQLIIQHYKTELKEGVELLEDLSNAEENTIHKLTSQELVYHHHDGYLMGVGLELIDFLREVDDWKLDDHRGLNWNLEKEYQTEEINKKGQNLHGDIEYLYYIFIENNKIVELYYMPIEFDDDKTKNTINEYLVNEKCLKELSFLTTNRLFFRDVKDEIIKINFNN